MAFVQGPPGCPDIDYEQGYIYAKPELNGGKCYQFVNSELDYTDARDFCRDKGSHLVTVRQNLVLVLSFFLKREQTIAAFS